MCQNHSIVLYWCFQSEFARAIWRSAFAYYINTVPPLFQSCGLQCEVFVMSMCVHPKCAKTSPSYVFSWCISMFPMWVCTCAYYITAVPPPLPRCGLQCEVYVIRSYWCSSLLVIIVSNVSLQYQCLLHHHSPAPSSPLRFAMCALRLPNCMELANPNPILPSIEACQTQMNFQLSILSATNWNLSSSYAFSTFYTTHPSFCHQLKSVNFPSGRHLCQSEGGLSEKLGSRSAIYETLAKYDSIVAKNKGHPISETQLELGPIVSWDTGTETVSLRDRRAVSETETPPPFPLAPPLHRLHLLNDDCFPSRDPWCLCVPPPSSRLSPKWVVSKHVLPTKAFPWAPNSSSLAMTIFSSSHPWQSSPTLSSFVETSLALFHVSRSLDPCYEVFLGSCGAQKCPTEFWEPNLFDAWQLDIASYQGF